MSGARRSGHLNPAPMSNLLWKLTIFVTVQPLMISQGQAPVAVQKWWQRNKRSCLKRRLKILKNNFKWQSSLNWAKMHKTDKTKRWSSWMKTIHLPTLQLNSQLLYSPKQVWICLSRRLAALIHTKSCRLEAMTQTSQLLTKPQNEKVRTLRQRCRLLV